MKMNKKIFLKSIFGLGISLGVSTTVLTPIILNNVSKNIFGKQVPSDLLILQISQAESSKTKLSDFVVSKVDVNRALYGSTSINGGNYMIGYMTLSNLQGEAAFDFPSTLENWDWIQSHRTGSGSPVITNDTDKILVHNKFLEEFFAPHNGLSSIANFYLIVDVNPNITFEIENNTEYVPQRFATPSSRWTQELILDQFNYFHPNNPENEVTGLRPNKYGVRPFIDIFDDLPSWEIDKENHFIRNDSSAIAYRSITDFVSRWKPQIIGMTGTTNDLSGFIAYTQTKTIDSTNPDHVPQIKPSLSLAIPKDGIEFIVQLRNYYLNIEQ